MSLVFAAIVPHAPLLIPSIGKEAIKKIDKTKRALEKLEEDLYLSHPDTIIIFSPHSHLLKDAFTINISPEHQSDLREFGDLATKLTVKGELNLMSQLRKAAEEQKITTKMITEAPMDHGLTIPSNSSDTSAPAGVNTSPSFIPPLKVMLYLVFALRLTR
jgi:aromatic ring-opening dioxygenase LigB subunit